MRKLVSVLALAVAALSVADYLGWRADQRRLLSLATELGVDRWQPEIATRLRRETVPARGAALLAWTLLDLEVDRGWLAELPPGQQQAETTRGLDRLETARTLAEEVLRRQPASWQAATVIGASRYLEASRRGQHDQPTSAWRDPLVAAMRLGPAYPEPATLLASAYLSRWSGLSSDERREVPAVLSRALQHAEGLELLLPAWVRYAPSLSRLLEPIPDRPAAWKALGREFLRRQDLERFAIAHRRRIESLPVDLAGRVERGRERLRGGHARAGIGLLLSVFSAPPDLAYADSFLAALEVVPEQAATGDALQDLERWRTWSLDLCAVGRCPWDRETMARLETACGRTGSLDLESGRVELTSRTEWPAGAWQRRGRSYRLSLRTAAEADELRLAMGRVPPPGAAVELRWDGRFLGVAALEPGESLLWRLPIAAGLHLLEVENLSGRPLHPGELTLGPARRPS